ncbi:hypothetical protein GE21DRAFT_3702 [Neurospora crassa]|uniref:C6 zinc finger domain-containing protein n=1 Tax=Neurospora crassa (strain ATCC 24698 / 74-OR23-1A / CBS 708.71 / DSM 1257 / FGSC 987) TaxID=367110 RepID=V5IQC3_NEUCR|nr:C6 zinc finger domain-containing protein [Neurospora crassa OR74A]ESA43729.1 C6 zinc finger domain-containing protein [Neurospora crassa OR74A]KHE79035.1 hypothetical protein GE21DRAFT_3702 [Neurospora crassa]|eukprot:XP_011393717.1 C6 zinc finger domain-containing protein [Neurospora crassa OR74A]
MSNRRLRSQETISSHRKVAMQYVNTTHLAFSKQVRGPSSRSKLACKQCRDRHVRCDQQQPCGICRRRNIRCSHGDDILFTALQWKPDKETAYEQRLSPVRIAGFVDETLQVSQLYHVLPHDVTHDNLVVSKTNNKGYIFSPASHTEVAAPITNEKDAFYLARYTDIIGPRFDMFDSTSRYFSLALPRMALSNRLVLLSCLACAARQYSLVTDRGHHDALVYYNEALKTLYERLNDSGHEEATFASCLLIAHCEMVESKASDWNLHLKGTGELVMMHHWNGRSGGLAQAGFWIYYRMIILASLASGMSAAVNLGQLLPLGYFPNPTGEWTLDAWQSKVVHLLGTTHRFWARIRNHHHHHHHHQDDTDTALDKLTAEWTSLGDQLLRHQSQAPAMCHALSVIPAANDNDDDISPFESVRYVNGPVSAAWQMLHTAYLVHTLSQPTPRAARLTLLSSSEVANKALSYARMIVANSIANRCTIAWANAVQLLTMAGQCLVDVKERQACFRALENIQHHTGWNTRVNMETLSAIWRRATIDGGGVSDLGRLLYITWMGDEVVVS